MGDESIQATIVSNNSSHDSFAGLLGAQDGSADWEPASIKHNTNNNNITNEAPTLKPSPGLSSTMPTNFPSSLIVSKNPLPILPSAGLAVSSAAINNTVPEFLYQLTKMLTGGHNDIIEWSNGRIEVHNPYKLESTVLQKYFRHSKFASFQRQLNYFGFRKLAGKGKMAPCSYVNEAATQDIGSLLLIKRKATSAPKDKNGRKQAVEKQKTTGLAASLSTAKGGVVHQVKGSATPVSFSFKNNASAVPKDNTQQAIAQAAVGRGIRHSIGFVSARSTAASLPVNNPTKSTAFMAPTGVQDSLSQLASNYQNSIGDLPSYPELGASQGQPQDTSFAAYASDPFPSLLSRNSSLVDLAMIPTLDENEALPFIPGMNFVDFPQPEVDPSKKYEGQDQQQEGFG